MKPLFIIGSSGHARVVIDCIETSGIFKIMGLIDDYRSVGSNTFSYPVIGTINDIKKISEENEAAYWFIAVGNNWNRYLIYNRLNELGLNYAKVIHPSAIIGKGVIVPKGTVIMPNVVINAGSYIGEFAIINTGAIIEHDNVVQDFSSLSPGVITGGNVHIGKFSFIGMGTIIRNGCTIGEHSVIGAGSVVLQFISAYKTAYGIPAKEISDRKKDDKYL